MRAIYQAMAIVLLLLLSITIETEAAVNHQGGGTTGHDITHSGIDLRGYHWVVIEVDDWGGGATGSIANATEYYELIDDGTGDIGFYHNSTLESVSDMDDYFAVLAKHPDVVVTAYFVMEFMDGQSMLANEFTEYVGVPINETGFIERTKYNSSSDNYRGDIVPKWIEGYTNGYWLPQYHARAHADMTWLLQNCSEGCETTINSVVNHSLGPVKMPGEPGAGYSKDEYQNSILLTIQLGECNKTTVEAQENLTIGLAEFYDLFGFHSETTVPPGHRCSNNTLAAFRNTTIYGTSSAPGYGLNETGSIVNWDWHVFDYFDGISIEGRSLSLNGKNITKLTTVMNAINTSFDRGQAAIFEDHRQGYVSGIRDTTAPGERNSSLQLLDELLTAIVTHYPDVWFLTTPELHQLNIKGYSVQNWTNKLVLRNALPSTQSIEVDLPSGWNSNHIRIKDDDGNVKGFSIQDSSIITVNVPHNDTFTIRQYTAPDLPAGGGGAPPATETEDGDELCGLSGDSCCGSTSAVMAVCVSWLGLVWTKRRSR